MCAVMFLFSCKEEDRVWSVGYYYWKNKSLDTAASATLDSAGIQFIYAKIADVVWNGRLKAPQPVTKLPGLLPDGYYMKNMAIVPVVFVTNEVLLQADSSGCRKLAADIQRYYTEWTTLYTNNISTELQMDCDWTPRSRDKYFYFLQELRRSLPGTAISVTLRLYPYKYTTLMGVPPVDKAVLMCYNMGNIKDYQEKNSILTIRTLQSYLVKKAYPLPLDLALPVYGWYVWYSNGEYKGILYENEYEQLLPYIQVKDSVYHTLTQNVATDFKYFRMGDEFRPEFPGEHELNASLSLLHKYFPDAQRLLLFHWEERHMERYGPLIRSWYAGGTKY